jgi:protein TonB
MPRRPSILLFSIATHAVAISAVIIASIVAPGVLPFPRDILAAPIERVVQLPDIPIPRVRKPSPPRSTDGGAPVVMPNQLPTTEPETSRPEPPGLAVEGDTGAAGDLTGVGTTIAGDTLMRRDPPVQERHDPIRLHSGIKAPVKIVDRRPEYPAIARQAGIQGVVIIELTITETGEVASAQVLRSVAALDQAALDAVRAWRFEPARLNGEPLAVIMSVTVNFQLGR